MADHTPRPDGPMVELELDLELDHADTHPATADRARRVQEAWSRMGGKLGLGFCLVGLLLVFLGWNGAASTDRVPSQVPYLISGGFAGLALVVVGVGLLVVQANRADRAALQASIRELRDALEAGAVAGAPGASAAAPAPGDTYRPARKRQTSPEVLAELDGAAVPRPAEPAATAPAEQPAKGAKRPRRRKAPITASER